MVRGEIDRHKKDLDAAEQNFERAMELIPGNATVYHWFSFVRSAQHRNDEAHTLLQRAHELDPMSRVIHVSYAVQPFFDGRDEESLAELELVKALHPDYPAVYEYFSWIAWSQGDPVEELRANLKVIELDPQSTRDIGLCYNYISLEAEESALDCITRSKNLKPMEKAFIRIYLHLLKGNRDMAQAVFDSMADLEGDSVFRSYAAILLGDFEVARGGLEQKHPDWFSGPAPDDIEKWDIDDAASVALVLQQSGEHDRATDLLSVALEKTSQLQRNRGAGAFGFSDVEIYALLGKREEALAALEECADLGYLSKWQNLKLLPQYDSIRDDPRFSAALARLSAAAEQAQSRAVSEGLL